MSECDPTEHGAGPARRAARALTLAGAAVGMWLLGQAAASAEEPLPIPLSQAVPAVQALAGSADQPADPVVTTVEAITAPIAPVVGPGVETVTTPLAAAGSQVAEIPPLDIAAPVVDTSDAPAAISRLVEPAALPAVEPTQQPAAANLASDGPPPASGPPAAVPEPGVPAPTTAAGVPTALVPADELVRDELVRDELVVVRAATPAVSAGPGVTTDLPPVPAVPHPLSVPALPLALTAATGHGAGQLLDQPSADLAAAVLAAAAVALSAAADDARDAAAAAPFEPSCSPD